MNSEPSIVNELLGTYRTFGDEGPVYHVEGKVDEAKVHIVVIESGEELDYAVDRALADPEAK